VVNKPYKKRTVIVLNVNHSPRKHVRPYAALLLLIALFHLVVGVYVLLTVYRDAVGLSSAAMALVLGGILLATLFPAGVLIALGGILHILTETDHDSR
jgi:predicted phage tail protein